MTKTEVEEGFNLKADEMTRAGLVFGHRASRTHPKMIPYISGKKNTVQIIDAEKTLEKFKEALQFIKEIISQNKTILIVGTKIQIRGLVENFAKECGLPFVNERWLGGTFTNFETLKKRIDYFKDLENKKASGELEKYTKKERAGMNEELRILGIKFRGIKNLEKTISEK